MSAPPVRLRWTHISVWLAIVVGLAAALVSALLVPSARSASETTALMRPGFAFGLAPAARQPLDLLWISDSSGWGVARFYARQIRQDLGVAVRVHDEWQGDLSAVSVLERLRTPSSTWINKIRNAEVIFVSGNPIGSVIVKGGDCMSTCEPPLEVGAQAWPKYIATLKAIFKRIFAIRKGAPVILRTANWYVPTIAHASASPLYKYVCWDDCGITDVCTQSFEWLSRAISSAAAAYRVPVADVYSAFNGPDHREDPVAKGYIQADNIHVNDTGRAVFADTLAALGYEPVKPTKQRRRFAIGGSVAPLRPARLVALVGLALALISAAHVGGARSAGLARRTTLGCASGSRPRERARDRLRAGR
jgi:hypothetical protein